MTDETVEQIVEDTIKALEAIADKSWIPWAAHLTPNMAHRVREEAEARAWEEHNQKF